MAVAAPGEAVYICPECRGKVKIVMNGKGQLYLLKHEEGEE